MNYLKGLVLGAGHSAIADFKTITRAYEVVLPVRTLWTQDGIE